MPVPILLPFESELATLANAGGKGANLSRLSRAGFHVPPGFILSTDAYRAYVESNRLQPVIQAALQDLDAEDAAALERASAAIRAAFAGGQIPAEVEAALRAGYGEDSAAPVAVRSSATAEDLPDLSFAGQQDTFLNMIGLAQVRRAVVDCWSSLWTGRAIGYRVRSGVGHADAALAVVVQQMVASEVSGVLFTANPLTGLLSEVVIDAAFGLGEALVSGQVEPDHYVVNTLAGAISQKTLGAKGVATRGRPGGGVETLPQPNAAQALDDDHIRRLAQIGQQIQAHYNAPQDVEWALAGGSLYVLQARPITSLFPIPKVSFDPLILWSSFGAVQGLVGPMTPLGRDAIRQILFGVCADLKIQITEDTYLFFPFAGERLWIKISDMIRHPLGRRLMNGLIELIEPSIGQIVRTLESDPRLGAGTGKFKFSTLRRLARFWLPVLGEFARNMLDPASARDRFNRHIDEYLAACQVLPAADRFGRLANVVAFLRSRVADALPFLLPKFVPLMGPSTSSLIMLQKIAGSEQSLALEVTRGLPHNVTTEMDLGLWQTAAALRADSAARQVFSQSSAVELAQLYLGGTLPPAGQAAVAAFMQRYGMRGVGEIDFGQPRWREDPAPVMHTLQSYLQIDPQLAPDVLFAKGEKAAEAALEKLAALARRQRGGWLKERIARGAARRIRLMMGTRESPKFFAIRVMGIGRKALLEVGQEFVAAGTLERPDDLVFLDLAELDALARNEARDWQALVAQRRAAYGRELKRKQTPRLLASDGRAFYEGVGAQTDSRDRITGSPVSPGVVEGRVHVILDPRGAQLVPGEILVCPGTDPAWTPLFMAAGGLVMEVGGMMTHGSVVAREYGIPAVVGVHQATLRLKNGQRIRVDGTQGTIHFLPEDDL